MAGRLEGKVALVVGGGSGMGRAGSDAMAAEGASVVVADVDLGATLFGHSLRAPLVIASMTGGHPRAEEINRRLAQAAEHFGLAMGVGSQRAAIRRPELLSTYTVARETAPGAFLIDRLGLGESGVFIDVEKRPNLRIILSKGCQEGSRQFLRGELAFLKQ